MASNCADRSGEQLTCTAVPWRLAAIPNNLSEIDECHCHAEFELHRAEHTLADSFHALHPRFCVGVTGLPALCARLQLGSDHFVECYSASAGRRISHHMCSFVPSPRV